MLGSLLYMHLQAGDNIIGMALVDVRRNVYVGKIDRILKEKILMTPGSEIDYIDNVKTETCQYRVIDPSRSHVYKRV